MRKNIRKNAVLLILLVILCVALGAVLLMLPGTDQQEDVPSPSGTAAPESILQVNAHPKVNALMERYYAAKSSGNVDQLKAVVKPCSEEDAGKVSRAAAYIESYKNIRTYTADGSREGSYVVLASYDMKFPNVDTLVPGMETMYVCTDEETGGLYINSDLDGLSGEERARIQSVVSNGEVSGMLSQVDARFQEIMAADESLKALYQQFGGQVNISSTPDPNATPTPTPTPDPNATEAPTPTPPPMEVTTDPPAVAGDVGKEMAAVVYAPVYGDENGQGETIDTLSVGAMVYVVSHASNGFSAIQLDSGSTGYVRTVNLASAVYRDDEVIASGACYSSCGGSGVEEMDSFDNETVYREYEYGNGWSQIHIDAGTAYIRTSQLAKPAQ